VNYSDFQHLKLDRDANGILVITINRPEAVS